MKKIISMLSIAILFLTGCGTAASDGGDVSHEGDGVLTIWGFFEGAPKVAMDYYEEQTGNQVEYQTIGWEDYQTKLNTVLGTDDAPDMLMLERSFMGSYLGSENILSLDDLMGEDEQFAAYKENTALATGGPGTVDGVVKAIGWENTASAFFYRSDLAETCLGITSVEEMEASTQTPEDYITLYEELQNSDNTTCSSMALVGYSDYEDAFLTSAGAYKLQDDGTYLISKEYGEALKLMKELADSGIVYSPDRDKTQVVSGNSEDKILGNIGAAWSTQAVLEYEQPGQWAVADTPLDFSAGGTFLAATPNADTEMVKEFLNMTFLNEQWLVDNMDTFGMVGNETVMNKYLETTDGSNEYFGGQNTVAKFAEINDAITDYNPVSVYDAGIGSSLEEVYSEYVISGTISTVEEAEELLQSKLNGLYPGLTVTIE